MNNNFCIIGAGSFGLMTALHLRKTYKNANITIFDINKNLSASVNGGNGIIDYEKDIRFKNISFTDIKKIVSINFSNVIMNVEFYIFHLINQILNNNSNRQLIKKITFEDENEIECETSDYYPYDYWDNLTDKLIKQNIKIKNMTEIINYIHKDNQIIISSKDGEEYICDKLILCTAGNLNLVKNNYYHKFIEIFSGYGAIIEVKNPPKCFYYNNAMFVTPYNNNLVKITFKVEVGSNNANYNIDKTHSKYNEIEKYIKNNVEIQNLGLINIINIWRGSRAMTYDTIPFIDQVDKNVYLLTGGGYIGTHMSYNFGKWLVELIDNKPFTELPVHNNKTFDPTLNRLVKIRNKYYFIIILIVLIIIIIIRIRIKKLKNFK
jgi:glycine/D-amino acid oxidase-like deaminating enzyme